jgi:hypothetical protein
VALLFRRDRPRITTGDVQLSYGQAVSESERVVDWVVDRLGRTRPKNLVPVADECLAALDAALTQLYCARRPERFPEQAHHDLVFALTKLSQRLLACLEADAAKPKLDVRREAEAFRQAYESLRATGVFGATALVQ